VTLVFLGSTDPGEVGRIWSAVPDDPVAPVLAGRGLVALPRRRPNVFALGLEDRDGRAAELQRAVAADLGRDEDRPWLPHVTLARVRKGHRAAHLATDAPELAPFIVPAISLLRSHPGSRYEVVERRALRAPGDQRS
jgi:2'-5' RNA ligase